MHWNNVSASLYMVENAFFIIEIPCIITFSSIRTQCDTGNCCIQILNLYVWFNLIYAYAYKQLIIGRIIWPYI